MKTVKLTRMPFRSCIILSSETSSVRGTIDFCCNTVRQTGSDVLTIASHGYFTATLQKCISRPNMLLLLVVIVG